MTALQLSLKLILFIAVGFAARKLKVIPDGFDKMLSRFVMAIPLPCMIIKSFDLEFSMDDLLSFPLIMGLAVLSVALVYIICRLVTGKMKPDLAKTLRFALTFSNFTFLGLPVVGEIYGARGAFNYVIFTLPIRIVFYGGAPLLLGRGGEKVDLRETLRQFFCAPVVAVFIGLIFYVTRLRLPSVLDSAVQTLGNMASPLGLILCGTIIANADWRGVLRYPVAFVISALRLLVIPALALGLDLLLGIEREIVRATIFFFAMPVPSFLPMFLLRYNPEAESERLVGGYMVFISTLGCIATIPMWTFLLEKI